MLLKIRLKTTLFFYLLCEMIGCCWHTYTHTTRLTELFYLFTFDKHFSRCFFSLATTTFKQPFWRLFFYTHSLTIYLEYKSCCVRPPEKKQQQLKTPELFFEKEKRKFFVNFVTFAGEWVEGSVFYFLLLSLTFLIL